MGTPAVAHPLRALNQAELIRLARVADRLLSGRPKITPGNRPHKLRAGHGIEFLDHRAFMPGDNPRDIDWRATARSRNPQIRRFRNETSSDWFICLDRSASMSLGNGRKWALAVQLTAALAYLLIHLDNRVGLLTFSDRVDGFKPLGRGHHAYAALLRLLESTHPRTSGGGTLLNGCASQLQSGSQIIVISDFLTADSLQPGLKLLAGIGEDLHAVQVLDENETLLPQSGALSLRDIETNEKISIHPTAEVQKQAEQQLANLIKNLQLHCQKHQIAFTSCTTADNWKSILLEHLTSLGLFNAKP